MHKTSRLGIVGLVLAMLAAVFVMKSVIFTTSAEATSPPPTMLLDEMHRTIDLKALPTQEVKDPV
jgi:hypothetical protein